GDGLEEDQVTRLQLVPAHRGQGALLLPRGPGDLHARGPPGPLDEPGAVVAVRTGAAPHVRQALFGQRPLDGDPGVALADDLPAVVADGEGEDVLLGFLRPLDLRPGLAPALGALHQAHHLADAVV